MTVDELIQKLTTHRETVGGDADVSIAWEGTSSDINGFFVATDDGDDSPTFFISITDDLYFYPDDAKWLEEIE